jgi:acyl carrier protein
MKYALYGGGDEGGNTMLDKIREIMTRYVELDPEQIQEDSRLAEDLALTSFAVMSMMGDFEEEFGITVDESELTDIYTVKDIMDYLEKKQA